MLANGSICSIVDCAKAELAITKEREDLARGALQAKKQAENMAQVAAQEIEIIDEAAHGEIRKKVRNLLGSFMFGEEEISKKIKVLSIILIWCRCAFIYFYNASPLICKSNFW